MITAGTKVRKHREVRSKPKEVIAIIDHRPCDGPIEHNAIAMFDDGTWEFVWNLVEV